MIKKISVLLASLALAASPLLATTWSLTANYPNSGTSATYYNIFGSQGVTYTATVSGVGFGSGNAHVFPMSSGGIPIVMTNTGGNAGVPFYQSNTSSPLASSLSTIKVYLYAMANSSGAYATSTVTSSW